MDENKIELGEPKLVPMRPKERADAARLLTALILIFVTRFQRRETSSNVA